MLFVSFASTRPWHTVVSLNLVCFLAYGFIIFRYYGLSGFNNDFYIHITTTIIFSCFLIRSNEVNMRNSFSLLTQSKQQEMKWQRVVTMLTDGVLILQHTRDHSGILLMNPSLHKIFKTKKQNPLQSSTGGEKEKKNSFDKGCSFKQRFNERFIGEPFDTLFHSIRFNIVYQENNYGLPPHEVTKQQFLNDFII